MILFKDDWKYYPEAIWNTKTENETFIRTAAIYKEMGISNCMWPLALHDRNLLDINPLSKSITMEEATMVMNESIVNPWYYFREIARLPATSGGDPFPFASNRSNLAVFWLFFNHVTVTNVQIRQTGKTKSVAMLIDYLLDIAATGTNFHIVSKDDKLRSETIQDIKAMRETLPEYFHSWLRTDKSNTHELSNGLLGNRLFSNVGQANPIKAKDMGRGHSVEIQWWDELTSILNVALALAASLAAGNAVRERAEMVGSFYGNIFTMNASKFDTPDGKFCYDLVHNSMYWSETCFDRANTKDLHKYIRQGSSDGRRTRVNISLNHRQLGKTDEWLASSIVNNEAEGDGMLMDWFNQWLSGSLRSPLTREQSEAIKRNREIPIYSDVSEKGFRIDWHLSREATKRAMDNDWHIVSLDSSNAIGRDPMGLVVQNSRALEVVAVSKVNDGNLTNYGFWVAEFLIKYPKTIIIIENKSSGMNIIDSICLKLIEAGINPFKRIFHRAVGDEYGPMSGAWHEIKNAKPQDIPRLVEQYRSGFGFMTTGQRRAMLYDEVLIEAANSTGHLVKDHQLVDELLGLIIDKSGRVDHTKDGHDDLSFSWVMGQWLVRYGKGLSWLGLKVKDVMGDVSNEGAIIKDGAAKERARNADIREKITALEQALAITVNPVIKHALVRDIDSLKGTLTDTGGAVNVNALKTEKEESKKPTTSSIREQMRRFLRR